MINVGVVLAGGTGTRFGSKIPKQYLNLAGHEVIYYSINSLKKSKFIDRIVVACDKLYQSIIKNKYKVDVCDGGATRNNTIQNVLDYINTNYTNVNKIIFIDSARPLCMTQNINECINLLDYNDCVITGQKIIDSLGCYYSRKLNREDFYLVQTPECFKYKIFNKYFNVNSKCTALYQQIPEDYSLYIYFGLTNNLKITYPNDIKYIENNFKDILNECNGGD